MGMVKRAAIGAMLFLAAGSTARADVHLTIHNGRVTIQATNATVRQILTEWARVGQTKIVNIERIPGGPLTLELTNVPERDALDLLLRSVTGYMAAARPVPATNLSQFDRILVLATAAIPRVPAPASATRTTPVFAPRPTFVQPPVQDENEDTPATVQSPRGPLFPTFPSPLNPQGVSPGAQFQPGVNGETPQQPNAPAAGAPGGIGPGTSAVGSPRPGMVVQPPPQPGQPPSAR